MIAVQISERGQITIPKEIRESFSVDAFDCKINNGDIILTPLFTKQQFLKEIKKRTKSK